MADMQRREEEGKERKGEDKGKQGERNKGRGGGKGRIQNARVIT